MFIRQLKVCVDFKRMHYSSEHRSARTYISQPLNTAKIVKKKKKMLAWLTLYKAASKWFLFHSEIFTNQG